MSQLISYSHRFIFIHVYKVAGKSVKAALWPYTRRPNPWGINTLLKRLGSSRRFPAHAHRKHANHLTARQLREQLPAWVFRGFFKFAFVRNPWDWQVSQYHYALGSPSHPQHELFKSMAGFEEYLEWRVAEEKIHQADFVTDEAGAPLADFVGRFETLAHDFAHVCRRVGIEADLPHLNKSSRRDYQSYYNPRTRRLIEEHFARDIASFGYTYDNRDIEQARAA